MIFETPLTIVDMPSLDSFVQKYKKIKFAKIVYDANLRIYYRTLIADQQGMRCIWCKCEMTHERDHHNSTTIEHMTPKSLGGLDDPSNYTVSCSSCNNKRGTLSVEAFTQLLMGNDKLANLERNPNWGREPNPNSNTSKRKARKLAMKTAHALNLPADKRPNFNNPQEVAEFNARSYSLV